MRRVRNTLLALLVGCLVPAVIWVAGGVALYQSRKGKATIRETLHILACSIDTECPPGYICLNGCCVPENAA